MADQEEQSVVPGLDSASTDGAVAVQAAPKQKPAKTPPKTYQLPPYKVLMHNDDVNDMEHVIRCIVRLTTLNVESAIERMLEAHQTGVALLLVTHKERAELYVEQFATFKLTVTIEPDE